MATISAAEYHTTMRTLRNFCESQGFIEVPAQSRPSILAACEDPKTVTLFQIGGKKWALPQTGQMCLEHELLEHPDSSGFYCVTTSYRDEKQRINGRHEFVFPLFEFEMPGNMNTLKIFEENLLEHLGFGPRCRYAYPSYKEATRALDVRDIDDTQEERMWRMYGPQIFLMHFPEHTSPFWNMKRKGSTANKIDVILFGMETIGSAERSTNKDQMREAFFTISEGRYADALFAAFSKEAVMEELKAFLAHDFFPRCGGGIGITRLIRALRIAGRL